MERLLSTRSGSRTAGPFSPLRWLCAPQLASLMVGWKVVRSKCWFLWWFLWRSGGKVHDRLCECLQHAVAPIAEHMNQTRHFFERKWSNRSMNKWWRRRPAIRILLPLWESHKTFFLSLNDGDMPRIQPALAFATEYIRTHGYTCK